MGERYFLRGLQGATFQSSMKCKGEGMAWENGDPHERETMEERGEYIHKDLSGCG